MYVSSSEYVMPRSTKGRHFHIPDLGKLISDAWNRRRWLFIGICAVLTITAVAVPAGIRYSMQPEEQGQSPPVRTLTEGEATEGHSHVRPKARSAHVRGASQAADHSKPRHKAQVKAPKPLVKIATAHHRSTTRNVHKVSRDVQHDKQELQNETEAPTPSTVKATTQHTLTEQTGNTTTQKERGHPHKAAKQSPVKSGGKDDVHRLPGPGNGTVGKFPAGSDHYVKNLRLPSTVTPEDYKLKFEPFFFDQSMMFAGRARITILCRQRTKVIQMHSSNMAIERANVSVTLLSGAPGPEVTSISTNDFAQFLYINLADDLVPGEKYYVYIPFKSMAFYDNGFNVRRYDRENSTVWMIGTNFLPTEARRAFPCFDEPGLKATYSVEVVRERHLHSLSNMPLSKIYPKPHDKEADTFLPSFPMSTFSMGFLISDFVPHGNSSFKVWTRPGVSNEVNFLLTNGPKILKFYEGYFSVPYQLSKMDVIAMEHYINDVQNMGMLFLPETVAFFDPDDGSNAKRQSVVQMLCHAFAHEWFGNLVTPEWWDDVWIMDGFATYFQYRCLEHLEGYHKIYEMMIIHEVAPVMKHDVMKYAPAVVTPVDSQYRIYQSFNIFSTQKAVAILRMLDMTIGESTFKSGVHKILSDRIFKNVTTAYVCKAFTDTQPQKRPLDVSKILLPWLTQSGFPVVSVTRVYDENAATLVQTKFSMDPEEQNSKHLWPIPITYVTAEELNYNKTRPLFWLREKEGQLENLPDPHQWIMLNNRFLGYFKVNYDEKNWELIIRQLLWNHSYIDLLNRAQIHNDLFDLAKAGMVNYTMALDATKYLSKEHEFIPWKTAFDKMKEFGSKMRKTDSYEKWTGYVSSLLKASFGNVSWDNSTSSVYSNEFESELVFTACHYGYGPCVEKATEMFNMLKNNVDADDDIPPHLRFAIFCEAVKSGGESNWKFLWNRLQSTDDKSERSDIVRALGCSKDSDTLGSYLKSAVTVNSVIMREDVPALLDSCLHNAEGRGVAFKFLRSQWRSIHTTYHQWPEVLFQIEESFIESATEPADMEELNSFYRHNKKSTMIPEWRYKQVEEEKKLDEVWHKKFYPVVKSWLSTAHVE